MSEELKDNLSPLEQELRKAETERAEAERKANELEAQAEQLKKSTELLKFNQHRKDCFDAALCTLELQPYDAKQTLHLLQVGGIPGVEIRQKSERCEVYCDGQPSSMVVALARMNKTNSNWFKHSTPNGNRESDPDSKIKDHSQIRSPEHAAGYIARNGLAKYEALFADSSKHYTGPAARLTAEQFKKLSTSEKVRATNEVGPEGIQAIMARKR
jgi:hypothetical protein